MTICIEKEGGTIVYILMRDIID